MSTTVRQSILLIGECFTEYRPRWKPCFKDPKVRVIVFASAIEKYFSTGAEIRVFDRISMKDLKIEFESAIKLAGTKDFSEGISAFLEKCEPTRD